MVALLRYLKKITIRFVLKTLYVFPVKKNRIFLLNDLSYRYVGNPRFIGDYLLSEYPGVFEIVVSVGDVSAYKYLVDKGLKVVKFNSPMYFFYAITAAVFVSNSGGYSYIPVRKKQCVINTWHGGGAYKKCGIHMYEDTPLFRKDLLLSANYTSIFLSTCSEFSKVMEDSMLIPREIFWEIGMPRNDMLLKQDKNKKDNIKRKIGLKDDEKLVLFAPTYRKIADNYFNDSIEISYGVDSKRVCKALEKRFGGHWKFAIRYHPCVVNRGEFHNDDVIVLSDYDEMQELLLIADAMINDFSSSMWDYMLTEKPSFLFAKDLDHYIKTTEVYTPVEEWPFPKATNNDELEANIMNFNIDQYKLACKQHYKKLGGCESGCATKLVCDRIYQYCFQN